MAEVKLTITGEDKSGPAVQSFENRAKSSFDSVSNSGVQASNMIKTAWDTLGVKSAADMDLARNRINSSFDAIKNSHASTQDEITRAEAARAKAIADIDKDNFATRTSLLDKFKENWLGITASIAAAWAATSWLRDAAAQALEAEVAFNKLKIQVEGLGLAYESVSPRINAAIDASSKYARIQDDEVAKTLQEMVFITGDLEGSMKKLNLAYDLAYQKGVSISEAAALVGKAMTGNVEMLGRYIPELRNLDETLGQNATTAEKTAYAMALLEEKSSGAMAKMTEHEKQLKESLKTWQDFKETIGAVALGLSSIAIKDLSFKTIREDVAGLVDVYTNLKNAILYGSDAAKQMADAHKASSAAAKDNGDANSKTAKDIASVAKAANDAALALEKLSPVGAADESNDISKQAGLALKQLDDQHQQGLISEQDYYDRREGIITEAYSRQFDIASGEFDRIEAEQSKLDPSKQWPKWLELESTLIQQSTKLKDLNWGFDINQLNLAFEKLQAIEAEQTRLLKQAQELASVELHTEGLQIDTIDNPWDKQTAQMELAYKEQKQATEDHIADLFNDQSKSVHDSWSLIAQYNADLAELEKKHAHDAISLENQIAMAKAEIVSTSIGQVGALMMTGNKHEFEEGKTLAETEAAINAALAIIKAYGQLGPVYGAIAAVGIGALLDKEINQIESQQYTGKAEGGYVSGGTPGVDSVRAMLMPGEVVIKKSAVDFYGVDRLLALNDKNLPHFADGGVVGSSSTDSSSNVVDLATYKAQKALKEQLEATDTLIDAVQANTTAVTKVADGLTKIAGVFDSVANYFSELPGVGGDTYSSKRNNELSKIYNTKGDVFKVSIDTLDLTNTLQDLYTSIKDAFSGESSFSIDTAVKDSKTLTDIKSLMQNAGIMGGSESITSQGIQLGYSGGSLQAGSYANITTEGGWFSNDSFDTQTAELDASLKKLLDDTVASIKDSVANAAAALGQTADGINSVTMELTNLDLTGLSDEDASAAVEAWLQDLGNAFASGIDGLDALVQPGENSYDALIRLAEALQTVNDSTTKLGGTVMDVSLSSADAASDLVDLMGGLDAFTTAADNYFSKFYTSAEQASMTAAAGYTDMSNALAAVGYSVPATSAEFRDMVNSLDLTTEAGQDAYAAFMSVTDGAAAFYDQAKAVADATKALNDDLTVRAYTAAGLDADASLYQLRLDQIAEVKKAEEDGLLTTEQITQLKIVQEAEWAKAVEDASATVSAVAQALVDSAQTALENMLDLQTTLLNKWKSLSTTDSSLSPKAAYDAAQTAFADASKPENWADLPAAIDQLLSASEAYNAHGAAYQADRQAALDILATAGGVSPDTTMEQVDEQITLLEAIKTALTDGTLADNSELINQLGPNSTLQELIATWSDATKAANDTAKVAAASQEYGKAYDTYLSASEEAKAAYDSGGSQEDYTTAIQSAHSALTSASQVAYDAGVTSFASAKTGLTYDFGQNWATLGMQLINAWAAGDHSGSQPDLQYDVAGKSSTDMTPNGIIDMNDFYALVAIASGVRDMPTYAVGSSFLDSDQTAALHYGEAVVDAQSNAVLQKYGIKVQTSGGNNDALIAEIRALRKEVKELKDQVERQGTAQVKVLSNGFMKTIEQGDEQNKTTKEMASKTRLASLNAA